MMGGMRIKIEDGESPKSKTNDQMCVTDYLTFSLSTAHFLQVTHTQAVDNFSKM